MDVRIASADGWLATGIVRNRRCVAIAGAIRLDRVSSAHLGRCIERPLAKKIMVGLGNL